MRVSLDWLQELSGLRDIAPREAARVLTMAGWNVEEIVEIDLSQILVGRVITQVPHPASRHRPRRGRSHRTPSKVRTGRRQANRQSNCKHQDRHRDGVREPLVARHVRVDGLGDRGLAARGAEELDRRDPRGQPAAREGLAFGLQAGGHGDRRIGRGQASP